MDKIEFRFWEQSLNFDWDTFSTNKEEFKQALRSCRAKMRKLKIISSNFFVGKEMLIMSILINSPCPAAEVGSCLDVTHPEAYRMIFYVKSIIRELIIYFDKGTYKEVRDTIKGFLGEKLHVILSIHSVTRSTATTAKALNYTSPIFIRKYLKEIDSTIKSLAVKYEAYKDFFVVWRRIKKIRKVSYNKRGALKNEFIHLSELKSHEWTKK